MSEPTTYTVVLIDRDPENAEDGDFVHVEGVTLADLTLPNSGDALLKRMADQMRACVARDLEVPTP